MLTTRTLAVLITAAGLALAAPVALACQLVLGVFPRWTATETFERFTPLAADLGRLLDCGVKMETTKDFASFGAAIAEGRYDLVHYNPVQHVRANQRFGYRAILMNEEGGERHLTGVIAVPKDSPVKRLAELRGKTILFGGDRDAMVTYVATTALLRRAGLKPGDYEERFALNPSQAILGLQHGRGDAATASAVFFSQPNFVSGLDPRAVRIIANTPPLPQLAWAVRRDMPAARAAKIQGALAGLVDTKAGRETLAQARLTRLWPAADVDFQRPLAMLRLLEGEQ